MLQKIGCIVVKSRGVVNLLVAACVQHRGGAAASCNGTRDTFTQMLSTAGDQ